MLLSYLCPCIPSSVCHRFHSSFLSVKLFFFLSISLNICFECSKSHCEYLLDWLQSLKQFFINVLFHILVASLTLMAQVIIKDILSSVKCPNEMFCINLTSPFTTSSLHDKMHTFFSSGHHKRYSFYCKVTLIIDLTPPFTTRSLHDRMHTSSAGTLV